MSDVSAIWRHLETIGVGPPVPTALYFADPMCSWCWGFSPVITELTRRYGDTISFQCVMGGLRAGNTVPTDSSFREEILHHWGSVHERTGQPFAFEGALADGFVYDTEPACRTMVTMTRLRPDGALGFLHLLQRAFYAEAKDVTRPEMLAQIAEQAGEDREQFLRDFNSTDTRNVTLAHFQLVRHFGVRGFPTIILVDHQSASLLTAGYAEAAVLAPRIDHWLQQIRQSSTPGN